MCAWAKNVMHSSHACPNTSFALFCSVSLLVIIIIFFAFLSLSSEFLQFAAHRFCTFKLDSVQLASNVDTKIDFCCGIRYKIFFKLFFLTNCFRIIAGFGHLDKEHVCHILNDIDVVVQRVFMC